MSNSLWPHGLYSPWNSPGQNTGVGGLSLLQEIFPTQGSNLGLPHCRQILYRLSHLQPVNNNKKKIFSWEKYGERGLYLTRWQMARLRVQSLKMIPFVKRCRQAADANEISVSSGASTKHGEAEQSHCCVVWGIWRKKHFCKRKQFCGVLYVMCSLSLLFQESRKRLILL